MGLIRVFLAAVSILTLSGCATQDAVLRKQAELESRLESVAVTNNMANQRLSVLTNELRDLQEQRKADVATLRELQDSVSNLKTLTRNLIARNTSLKTSATAQKIELINNDDSGTAPLKEDVRSEAYMKAFGQYSADKYEEAIEAFTAFIKAYPDSEYAANAQYWIGECYYSRSNLPKALDAFNRVLSDYPGGNKVPDAMLKVGYTLFAMKQPDKGADMLESLISKYPDSPAAVKAKEKLLLR